MSYTKERSELMIALGRSKGVLRLSKYDSSEPWIPEVRDLVHKGLVEAVEAFVQALDNDVNQQQS